MLETKRATYTAKLLIERTMCSLQGSSVTKVPPRIHIPGAILHGQFEASQSYHPVSTTIPLHASDDGHLQLVWLDFWSWWEVIQLITTVNCKINIFYNCKLDILTNYIFSFKVIISLTITGLQLPQMYFSICKKFMISRCFKFEIWASVLSR